MKKLYIGIDIGGTSIKGAFVERDGTIRTRFGFPIIKGEPQEETMERLGSLVLSEMEGQGLSSKDFVGIGVGCPGSINSKEGVCCYSNNLGWDNLPIASLLSKKCGLPTKVSNDANVAMLGEATFGAAKNYTNAVLVTIGTGVGGGLFLNGKLFEGNEGKGAEIGHMVIQMDGGLPCTCGRLGCFETYASVTALIRMTKEAMHAHPESKMWGYVNNELDEVNGKTAFETSKMGDEAAKAVVDTYENYLTVGLLNLCNIFRPEVILLGGGLSNQREYLTDAVKKKLEEKHYGFEGTPKVDVVVTKLGNDAGILGAAALFMEE